MTGAPDELLAEYVSSAANHAPSPAVQEKAINCLLDALSLAVTAAEHPVTLAVESLGIALPQGGSTSWASGSRMSVQDAFLANGTAVHAHFQDDTDMVSWSHPASLVTPVAVGLAENQDLPLSHALRGLIAGYAALTWLGAEEVVARQLVERGFRAGPTLGAIAAACAGAATLGLTQLPALHAIGIAADSTGAILEPVRDGAQDWRLQGGFAAQRGGVAAILAQRGVSGPSRPLTGARGFLSTFTDGAIPGPWAAPPRDESIFDVWFKQYPTLGDNMAPAIAAALLMPSMPTVHDVHHIVIHMNAHFASYPGTQFMGPFERTDQMVASTAFAVAALLTKGDLVYEDYESLSNDPRILDLVSKTKIIADPNLSYTQGSVEVHTSTGILTSRTEDAPTTLFFRDRVTTLDVLEQRHGHGARRAAQQIFNWNDALAPEPSMSEVIRNLELWRDPR